MIINIICGFLVGLVVSLFAIDIRTIIKNRNRTIIEIDAASMVIEKFNYPSMDATIENMNQFLREILLEFKFEMMPIEEIHEFINKQKHNIHLRYSSNHILYVNDEELLALFMLKHPEHIIKVHRKKSEKSLLTRLEKLIGFCS